MNESSWDYVYRMLIIVLLLAIVAAIIWVGDKIEKLQESLRSAKAPEGKKNETTDR